MILNKGDILTQRGYLELVCPVVGNILDFGNNLYVEILGLIPREVFRRFLVSSIKMVVHFLPSLWSYRLPSVILSFLLIVVVSCLDLDSLVAL